MGAVLPEIRLGILNRTASAPLNPLIHARASVKCVVWARNGIRRATGRPARAMTAAGLDALDEPGKVRPGLVMFTV